MLTFRNGNAYVGESSVSEIIAEHGSPAYLYDAKTLLDQVRYVRQCFGERLSILFAAKANSNVHLLELFRHEVDGLDISSKGELRQAQLAGYTGEQLSFAGPAKTAAELHSAIEAGVGAISVESLREINDLIAVSKKLDRPAKVALRINPQLEIKGFAIKMGGRPTQFGVDEEDLAEAVKLIQGSADQLEFVGIHVYAGTQCMDPASLVQNMKNTLRIAKAVTDTSGLAVPSINYGGGFGISYFQEGNELDLPAVAAEIRPMIEASAARQMVELGRYLVAAGGVYIARVVSEKVSRGTPYYVLDGGMNHHIAASGNLGSFLRRNYVAKNISNPDGELTKCNLVGPLCTPMDLMGAGVSLPQPRVGDLIVFMNSGSYGFTASPLLWLGHATPIELLHDSGSVRVIRKRFTLESFN